MSLFPGPTRRRQFVIGGAMPCTHQTSYSVTHLCIIFDRYFHLVSQWSCYKTGKFMPQLAAQRNLRNKCHKTLTKLAWMSQSHTVYHIVNWYGLKWVRTQFLVLGTPLVSLCVTVCYPRWDTYSDLCPGDCQLPLDYLRLKRRKKRASSI